MMLWYRKGFLNYETAEIIEHMAIVVCRELEECKITCRSIIGVPAVVRTVRVRER